MRIHAAVVSSVCLLCAGVAVAQSTLTRNIIPNEWLNPVMPEDLPKLSHPAYTDGLDHARAEAFSGRYKKSLQTLMVIAEGAANPVEVALVKGTALSALGRQDEALAALSAAKVSDDPRAQVMRCQILCQLRRPQDAISLLKDHLEKFPRSIAGHFQLGQAYELIGDLDSARSAYGWFVVEPQDFLARWQRDQEKAFDNAEELTIIGRAIDRWATLTGGYKDLPQLHDTLLNLFVRTYDVIDRAYWPAHVAAAEYYLSHDNSDQAKEELAAANKANPSDPATLRLMGTILVSEFNFDGADKMIDELRNVDPHSYAADLLEARNLLQQRRPQDAATRVNRVLEKQPNNLEALGLLAATEALQLRDQQTAEILSRVEKIDPDNATAYLEVAEQLGAMRQYPRAIEKYKVAIERAPWWTEARNGLGLLYTQSGDEDDAKATLDAAHAWDPYNLRTTNYLRLLDDLSNFARKETAHFIVMYDAKVDPIIPEYFSDYLESIHADVTKTYQAEPPVKTYIEVFPTHDAFSVRTTGSPWIGTVGASTGRVIAMVSPRKGEATMGAFNWAQVLRHEYTHTVTLAATDNRIPHWMTEGLAVYEEHSPLKWEWVPMLYSAVNNNGLFTMENLTWGFVRPRKPTDRSLAYAESYWICKYIQETDGHDAILKMLQAFKNGSTEKAAFETVLNKSLAQFQSEFFAWTKKQVESWGYDKETSEKYDKLREKGEAQIKAGQYPQALVSWQEIAKLRPVDALPHSRLAGLYLTKQINQPEKAIEELKVLHAVELKDNRYAKQIARIYRDIGKFDLAKTYAMQSVYIDPYDLDAHKLSLEIAERASDAPTSEREKQVIPVLEQWIEANRSRPLN
jgi:tetratricopeptide (TPR) repeat protein